MKRSLSGLLLIALTTANADETTTDQQTRTDAVPQEHVENVSETYLEAYIQALIDMHYYEYNVIVSVEGKTVYLSNLPDNSLLSHSILAFVQDIPSVKEVKIRKMSHEEIVKETHELQRPHVNGIWFPQSTIIFPPLIADPRQPINSVNYRWGDRKISGQDSVAVSIGDDFPVFRWRNVFRWQGDLQIGIEAGIWAIFNFSDTPENDNGDICQLVNTDYFVGVPLSYGYDKWSWRLRVYHISSHLGDEFLCNHPFRICNRKNPSFEAIDLYASYQAASGVRIYGGPGYIFHSDNSFHLKPIYFTWGGEFRFFGRKFSYHRLYGTPFVAINFSNWQQRNFDFDTTVMTGYEFSKLQGVGRKFRAYVQYHNGYSWEGQFFNCRTSYAELGFSWGF